MKFGSVALIGKSNVGKSTFINQVLKLKLCITSSKVQTTRNTICGIYNDDNSQIVIYDTPGFYKEMNMMNREMMKETRKSLNSADVILYFINSYDKINDTDKGIMDLLRSSEIPTILVVNKSDLIKDSDDFYERIKPFKEYGLFTDSVAISALNNINVDNLIRDLKEKFSEGYPVYDEDLFTDRPVRFICEEYIREKTINLTKEEVPHSIHVQIEQYLEQDDLNQVTIEASIIVEKDSQKPIIIGKGGKMIKEIGIESRRDIEALIGCHCILNLFVKVKDNWRDNKNLLKTYGLLSKKDE